MEVIADQTPRCFKDENETVQFEHIFLSSDEDTASQYPKSNQHLTEKDDTQY